jgi:membrane-associated phospholipid phosphatase
MNGKTLFLMAAICVSLSLQAAGQSETDLAALKGLAPVTVLLSTPQGAAALAANYTMTGGIQTGEIRQSLLLPFPEQQQQALRDVAITNGNLAQLADGLGTTLGAAYVARAHYLDQTHWTDVSKTVAGVIAYATNTAGEHANAGKFFFANATTDGTAPVTAEAAAILKQRNGVTDIFGKSYGLPAGTAGADLYGNSRPFETEASVVQFLGPDYFNVPAGNRVYNRGPLMNLINSPSYPSGHTTYGYTGALVLAILVPDRYQQMIARGAEYGNDRILVGAHYAMDVLGGRTLAMYDMAHLLANDPAYLTQTNGLAIGKDFRATIIAARADVTAVLQSGCGKAVQACAREDIGRFSNPAENEAFYAGTQTYSLRGVYSATANTVEEVGKLAPEAGYLLTSAFPSLTLEQADQILTESEGPGGGFLDDGSSFGLYSRLNLYAAAGKAAVVAGHAGRAGRGGDK